MEDRSNFLRQRRSLMVISLILLFAEVSGIKMHEINLFGNKVLLENPEIVNLALWIGLFYWFVRYYQYFREIKYKGFGIDYGSRMHKLIKHKAKTILLKNIKKPDNPKLKDKFDIEKEVVIKASLKQYKIIFHIFYYYEKDDIYGERGVRINKEVLLSFKQIIIPAIRSFIYVQIHTKYFTEYVLPFVLFLLPIFYKVYTLFQKT